MSFRKHVLRVCSFAGRRQSPRRPQKNERHLQLESLEDRVQPSIVFKPQFGPEPVQHQLNNLILGQQTPVFLIFWGAEWSDGQGNLNSSANKFVQAAMNVFPGPYLSALAQYDPALGNAHIQGAFLDARSEPMSSQGGPFSQGDLLNFVGATDDLKPVSVPEVDDGNLNGIKPLYVVITPPGVQSDQPGAIGYHTYGYTAGFEFDEPFTYPTDPAPVAWVSTIGSFDLPQNPAQAQENLDFSTKVLSHEVVEATTDPNPSPGNWSLLAGPGKNWPSPDPGFPEACDNEAKSYAYRVNGTMVQSYWWNNGQAFVVPDGTNSQNYYVDNGTLHVTGGQLPNNGGDKITIDVAQSGPSQGGVTVSLDGYGGTFEPGAIKSIIVTTFAGQNQVLVKNTSVPVTINDGDNDSVEIGNGSVEGIKASVTVNNPSHFTKLTVNNENDEMGHDLVTITDSKITGFAADINYTGKELASLTIKGGHGINTYVVVSTPFGPSAERGVPVTLDLGKSSTPTGITKNFVTVGKDTLDAIHGELTINSDFDHLNINDQGANAGHDYVLGVNMLMRTGAAPIIWGGLGPIEIDGSSHVNRLIGPDVSNTWNLTGPNKGSLDGISFTGMQNLTGGSQSDVFTFKNSSARVAGMIDGGGSINNSLDYQAYGAALTVNLTSISSGTATGIGLGFTNINSLMGNNAGDSLVGPNLSSNDWTINGTSAGMLQEEAILVPIGGPTQFSFQKINGLVGGNGVDTFKFLAGGSIGSIDGGSPAGGDWLDYSAFGGQVTVDLTKGQATGVSPGGVTHIENVRGSNFNDTLTGSPLGSILIGGTSTNILRGAGGRNLLIGGQGKANITAGPGGDILIAGWTDYDSDNWALATIMAEWRSADSYANRLTALENGVGLNQSYKLNGNTVHHAAAVDTLMGGSEDWYFLHMGGGSINGQSGSVYWIP
jgi:hypothetical protein